MTGSVEWQLGEINARLRAIETRLAEGSDRHAELDKRDDGLADRVVKLELIEAKRAGALAGFAALGTLIGGALTLLLQNVLRKMGVS